MTLTLDVEHANSTSTLKILAPDALGDADAPSMRTLRIERKVIRQPEGADRAEAVVYRDAWDDVVSALDRRDDRFLIRGASGSIIFGGRLADVERSDITVSVIIESGKRDAIDAAPSGGNDAYPPQPDVDILQNELLPRVGTVAAGSLAQQDASIAFSESHASPGKSITKLARDAGAEVRYEPTSGSGFRLDYVGRLGSDRSGETLSPSAAKVLGEPRVRQRTLEDVSHVTVLGANSGGAQIEATAVVSSFSAGDRAVHRRRVDKEIVDQSRAQKLADQLVAEYDGSPRYLEVECEIPTRVAPSLGDRFAVQIPDHGVNQTLRITMLERILDEAGDRFRALLTNRRLTTDLQGDQKALELNSLSEGNAGQYYAITDSEGWDAVGSGEPYEFIFYRPVDTIGELRAKLRLESREYRLRADQVGHSHTVSVNHPSHSHLVSGTTDIVPNASETELHEFVFSTLTIPEGTRTAVNSYSVNTPAYPYLVYVTVGKDPSSADFNSIEVFARKANQTDSYNVIQSSASLGQGYAGFGYIPDDLVGDDLELVININTVNGTDPVIDGQWTIIAIPPHDHGVNETSTQALGRTVSETTDSVAAVDPGINTIQGEQVSNVALDINGSTVASGLSHPIDTTVDITGIMSDGPNPVTISSDALGELRATIEYEAIKNADS